MKKLLPLIEQMILSSYPEVMDVSFTKKNVYLGSSPELPEKERTIEVIQINVSFNNISGNHSWGFLWEKRKEIIDNVSSIFSINHMLYGSKWDFDFYEVKKIPLRN